MANKKLTRAQLQEQFKSELYLSASFFKMRRVTEGDKYTPLRELDAKINNIAGGCKGSMANREVTERFIPEREVMPKYPSGRGK